MLPSNPEGPFTSSPDTVITKWRKKTDSMIRDESHWSLYRFPIECSRTLVDLGLDLVQNLVQDWDLGVLDVHPIPNLGVEDVVAGGV